MVENESVITPAQIEEQLQRILSAPYFKRSKVLCRFLTYVVTETLEGRGELIKEYTIGFHVLNKEASFNPQTDSIVRVNAIKLRQLLDLYYQSDGKDDPITITIPKGKYQPVIEKGTKKSRSAGNVVVQMEPFVGKPRLAIIPFRKYDEDARINVICSVLCEELSIAFTPFEEIFVIAYHSALSALEKGGEPLDAALTLDADFLMTGSCSMQDDILNIHIELISTQNNKQIWGETFMIEAAGSDRLYQFPVVIRKVVSASGGFFGQIYRHSLSAYLPEHYSYMYAIYWHNKYHRQFSYEAFQEASWAIERGLEQNPENPLLLSLKAEFLFNLKAMDVNGSQDYLKIGLELIYKAVAIDPNCQHAYQVMAWACLLRHDEKEFHRSVEKMLTINPNNAMYMAEAGFGYICIGQYEKGLKYITDSLPLNPYYPWNINAGLCLYYLKYEDYEEALYWANLINRPALLWDSLLKTAVLGLLGKPKDAGSLIAKINTLSPDFPSRAQEIVNTFLFDAELKKTILRGLRLAGMEIL